MSNYNRSGNKWNINELLSLQREYELLELTIQDSKNTGGKHKELTLMRDGIIDYFEGGNKYNFNDEYLEKYFYFFNYIAATEKGR